MPAPYRTSSFRKAPDAPALPNRTLAFIAHCLRPFWGWVVLMVVLEAGQALAAILVPYAIKTVMDAVTQPTSATAIAEAFQAPLLLLVVVNVAEIVFSRASGAALITLGPRLRQHTSRQLYAYLQHHSPRYFSEHFAGGLAHRVSDTAMSVNHTLWSVLCDFWPIIITFVGSIALLLQSHWQLGSWLALWVLLYVLASYGLARRCQPYAEDYAATRSLVNGKLVDAVTNMLNVKFFARLDYERAHLDQYLETEVQAGRRTFWYMERVRWFQFIATAILKVGTIVYALQLWQAGAISVGDFAMSTGLALMMIGDASNLTRRFLEFFEYIGTVANGVSTIVQPHDIVDAPDAKPLQVSAGRIAFKDVSFAYQAGKPVFQHINVVIEAGQHVGLVGYSGSGKSTFVNLLLRSYEPQSGEISIDGQAIQQATLASLHQHISLIPQDPSLFHRSLRDNIAYGRINASDAALHQAARLANADGFIQAMPDAYEAMVGERGVKLSGGQRQRIAIARVMLKDAPIVILDEATASLDSVTEKTIQDNLDSHLRHKTVIAIAHRLSTIAHLDRILVFDNGQIVEDGSHADLLAQQGLYYRLWSMQAGGFLPETAS